MRTGIGFDTHRLAENRPLVLGLVTIPHERGLLGHSDADALVHAVIDALLGAVADGDIGGHFPDSDPQWKGADSGVLLEMTLARLAALGWRVNNVDATIIAERPKLAPFIPAMREKLAARMRIPLGAVSVKAKTNEGLDATGRCEGISVMAVATVTAAEQGGNQ